MGAVEVPAVVTASGDQSRPRHQRACARTIAAPLRHNAGGSARDNHERDCPAQHLCMQFVQSTSNISFFGDVSLGARPRQFLGAAACLPPGLAARP